MQKLHGRILCLLSTLSREEDLVMQIYLTNLGKYNEGELVGKWLKLPYPNSELEAALLEIGIGERYEEYFITDYENDIGLRVREYDSLDELNEIAERVSSLDSYETMLLQAMIEHESPDTSELLELIDRLDEYSLLSDVDSDEDLGHYWLFESGCYNLDNLGTLVDFLDCESFGRAIRLDSSGEFTSYGWLELCG
jgi:antirestriction protein